MSRKEALSNQHSAISQKEAISSQHSAVSENQPQTQEERVRQRSEALLKRIGEACDELERLAEENPELVGRVTVGAEEHKEAYLRLKARLALADSAPRCRWVRQDGTTCGSPQMKRHIYCFAHMQMAEAQALALQLPALEDANAIIIGIMRIQKALIDGTVSTKTAGLLLYSMQLALQAVGKTTFGQVKGQELVRETVDGEEALQEALSSQHSALSQNQNQRPFTTESIEDAEEGKTVPRINTDGHGWQERPKQVEWKPTPDMYRMDTREGREAYEASFKIKIGTSGDPTPVRAKAAQVGTPALRHEIAETRINQG
jgi:hypothetical protein